MGRQLVPLDLETVPDLPVRCLSCVFWEMEPVEAALVRRRGQALLEKEAWLSSVLLEWGTCGRVAYIDRNPVGFVSYAPPEAVPRAPLFSSGPVSPDAVLLMTSWLHPEARGQGLGRALLQSAAKDVLGRGFRALEAFGASPAAASGCVLPVGYLEAVGFRVVREHPVYPRLRMDLHTLIDRISEMGAFIDRLLGGARLPAGGVVRPSRA
ncbi:GNAT family N-acetyltransferase [Streptomyces alkaliphilus]|uniref:GNAT family N-acetyltransferase n=1 Tax=Streptomyces alkaliphilus TaxID=1472722 RepID=A0A7W3TF02_9ACTN|nr:GNAT family N-acetyltransferase [Streptomyces alkaliphilus]MBB0245614.1 GNAT family N-acetyltransferase [Streptomyces alkaliphilus]